MPVRHVLKTGFAACLVVAAGAALAHDTWFDPSATQGEATMALGTGNRFPVQEYAVAEENLRRSGCVGGDGKPTALVTLRETPTALLMQAPMNRAGLTCWAQLAPIEIELTADKVKLYLREIKAPQATHEAWARMQARGIVWSQSRNASHPAPPPQIRTCGTTAYGSCLGS